MGEPGQAASEQALTTGVTDANGLFGFPTPADRPSEDIELVIEAPGCNARRIRLDGPSREVGLRKALFAESSG